MHRMVEINDADLELLKVVLEKQAPELIPWMQLIRTSPFTDDQLNLLKEKVADEIIDEGLAMDDELNEYGLRLDVLIGILHCCP